MFKTREMPLEPTTTMTQSMRRVVEAHQKLTVVQRYGGEFHPEYSDLPPSD